MSWRHANKPRCSARLPRLPLPQTNECLRETSHSHDRPCAGGAVTGTVSAVDSDLSAPSLRAPLPLAVPKSLPDASLQDVFFPALPHLQR